MVVRASGEELGAGSHRLGERGAGDAAGVDAAGAGRRRGVVDQRRPRLSVVVPIFDESASLAALHRALVPVLARLEPCELVLVDDGSRDDSWERARSLQRLDARIRLLKLAGNHGQHLALAAGLDAARGEAVVTLDADLQNDPRDIPRLVAALSEGHDYVSGRRRSRRDPALRRIASWLANRMVTRWTGLGFRDHFSALKGFSPELVTAMGAYREERRCLPVLAAALARSPIEIDAAHSPQRRPSRYSLRRLVALFRCCRRAARRLRSAGPSSGTAPPLYEIEEQL